MSVDYVEENILIPKRLLKPTGKHKYPNQWIEVYYYVNKKRTQAIVAKNVATSKMNVRKNTFYKVNNLSKTDSLWDYYRILKKDIANKPKVKKVGRINLLKSNNTRGLARHSKRDTTWKGPRTKGLEYHYKDIVMHF